jgi:hypothetical protein
LGRQHRPEAGHSATRRLPLPFCHEPPLWSLLEDDPESQEMLQEGARSLEEVGRRVAAGDHEGAARQFVEEVALGPGAWENELPAEIRAVFVQNAPTYRVDNGHGCSRQSSRP